MSKCENFICQMSKCQMYSDQTAYVVYLHDDNVNVLSGLVLFGKSTDIAHDSLLVARMLEPRAEIWWYRNVVGQLLVAGWIVHNVSKQ